MRSPAGVCERGPIDGPRSLLKCPLIQLGAENNIEKSRCLAQMRKKIFARGARGAGFSGFRVEQ
jgi:hypothetical protein